VKVFTGPDARQQAIRYAEREFGAYDEIQLVVPRTLALDRSISL